MQQTRGYLFDADGSDREVPLSEALLTELNERQLLWLDLTSSDAGEIRAVARRLGLTDESLQALLKEPGRPDLDHYGDYLQLSINAVNREPGGYKPAAVHVVAGRNYVMTLHTGKVQFLSAVHEHVKGDTPIGRLDSAAFLASLLDRHVGSYLQLLEPIEVAVDRLDEAVLRDPDSRQHLQSMVVLRRRVGALRRLLAQHRSLYAALARPDFAVYIGDEPEQHLQMLDERFEHALESVEHARELVLGSFDLYMTSTSQRTNDTMRVLTVVTVALGMVAAVAGVLGTNFSDVPLFKLGERGFRDMLWGTGALIVVTLIVGRWRRWL